MSSRAAEDSKELDAILAAWRLRDEAERQRALDALHGLIDSWCPPDDLEGQTCARCWGEQLLRQVTFADAIRVFRALAGNQLLAAMRIAHRNAGGYAAFAVERLIVDGLRLPRPAYDFDPEDELCCGKITAREVARSARTGLGHMPPLDSHLSRLWDALRLRVCAARRSPSWPTRPRLLAALIARLADDAARASALALLPGPRPSPVLSGSYHYTSQPRLTRGPDACPSLTSTHVEGLARQRAPQGSAVAA